LNNFPFEHLCVYIRVRVCVRVIAPPSLRECAHRTPSATIA
jgi:hypothetical protein